MVSHQTLCDLPSPQPSSQHHHHHQQSIYQPCLPPFDPGATKILPFLYLGSQTDAFNKDLLKSHNITYELNVSTTCPKPDHVKESHFLRIPVNDSYNERLIPYFPIAFDFLEKVRKSEGCALVHCFAGISRSTTIVIAYLMQHSRLTFDDAYRYVKSKRATISPNFHFLGQLLEYEEILKKEWITEPNKVDTILLSPLPIKEDISIEQKPLYSPTIMPLSSSCSALSSLTSPAPSGQPPNGKRHNLTLKMPTKSQRNVDEVTDNSQNQADQSSNDTLTKLSFSNSNSTSTSQSINSSEICDRLKQRPIEEIISTCPRAGRRSESCSSQTVPIGDPMPSSATTNVTRTAEKRRADSSTSTISFNLPLRSYAKSDSQENGIDPHIKTKTGKIEENNQVPIPMRCSTGEHSSEEEFCTRSEISMDTTAGSSSPESSQESVHDNSSTLASKVSDIKNCSSVPIEDPDFEPMVLRRDIMDRKCNPSVTSQDSAYVSMIMDSGRGTLFLWLVAKK